MGEIRVSAAQATVLGHYVYVYYDAETGAPFYIGRGQGPRVGSHINRGHNNDVTDRIKKGNYAVDFLAYGLNKESAEKVEAAAIDLYGIDNLLNKTRGTGARTFGRIGVETLLRSIEPELLTEAPHNLVLVPINETYDRYGDDRVALFESTRGVWNIGQSTGMLDEVELVAGVVRGHIAYVMEVAGWFHAGQNNYFRRLEMIQMNKAGVVSDGRVEFAGRDAPPEIQDLYLGRRVLGKGNIQGHVFLGPFHSEQIYRDGSWQPVTEVE